MAIPREARQLGRYRLQRTLGSGSMGTVYEALDTTRGDRVALKRLKQVDPTNVQRFKQEFRLARAIAHPNLVTLYDLVVDGTAAYFTMELVSGVDWLVHLAAGVESAEERSVRIGDSLKQLVEAVDAMHRQAIVHLDLKPSNVLVTAEGRVVVLDFGLATAFADNLKTGQATSGLRGTLQYIAPEHFTTEVGFSESSDWYSVGVMLFQALTGRSPPIGRPPQFPDGDLGDGSSGQSTLAHICRRLIEASPKDRATGASVLDALSAWGAPHEQRPSAVYRAVAEAVFVGRQRELSALNAALSDVSDLSRSRVVAIEGAPGVGKSTLVRHFLSREDVNVLALSSRCYEREAVAFKAWDVLVDGLSDHLSQLPDVERASLLPRHFRELTRIFPALSDFDTEILRGSAPAARDGADARRRAFQAFKELIARLSDRYRLVIWLDDLQWADDDSVDLLAALLSPPDPPAALFALCLRSNGAEDAARQRIAEAVAAATNDSTAQLSLRLDPLTDAESQELARRLLRDRAPEGSVRRVARESFGSPYLLRALAARAIRTGTEATEGDGTTATSLVLEQVATLPEGARAIVELVAATGQPVEEDVLLRARDLRLAGDRDGARVELQRLYAQALLRMTELRGEVAVDVYHDCVRDAVRGALPPGTSTALHRALALAIETRALPSWERLATHWHLAGDDQRAFDAALKAADQASASFAFSRAADFYALARNCGAGGAAAGVAEKRATALVYAGRCAEAAVEFLEAARCAGDDATAFTFRRRSAEMHLVSGQWAEGLSLLEPLFESLGIRLATRPWLARAAFLYLLARVRSRNFDFERRAEHDCDPILLRKVDVCLAATNGLVAVDPRRGLTFLMRAAVYAVQAGEPRRVCHAWALYLCAESGLAETSASWLDGEWDRLRELAASCHSPELELAIDTMHAIGLSLVGRFEASSHSLERTDATLRGDGRAVTFHFGGRLGFITNSRYFAGDLDGFVRLCQRHRAESQAAGDWLSESGARLFVTFDALRRGEVDEARAVIQAAIEGWHGFHSMHAWAAFAGISASLYEGDGQRAMRELDAFWPDLELAGILGLRLWGAVFRLLRAMACLCCSAQGADGVAKTIRRMERQLSASQEGWVQAFGTLVRARRLLHGGDIEESIRVHDEAASAFERHSMALYAACTRRRQGELLGDAGLPLIHAADAFMRSHGIVDPERWTRMYAA